MAELEWEPRLERTRAEAQAFAPFLGRWTGSGHAHGEKSTGELVGEAILDGSHIEVRERVDGHEDRCLYRFEVDDMSLRVMHIFAGGTVREYPVERTPSGLVWITPPSEPSVEWHFGSDQLRCEVRWPGADQPDVTMSWTRA